MKIAIFTNNYLPNPFGVAASIESFRAEFEKLGHTVYVFAPEFEGYVDENKNVFRYPAIDLTFRNIRFPIAIPYSHQIDGILEKLEIDVIHAQHPNLIGWAAKKWAKKKNVPLVFTWHTLYDQYAHFVPLVPKKIAAWWAIGNAKRYANSADQIIVPTSSVETIIKTWGVTNKNITAISSGVVAQTFANPDRKIFREKFAIKDDDIVLLLVSRLTAEKNVEFLLRAVAPLLQENKALKFVIAGEGGELEKLKKIVQDFQIEDNVFFQGITARSEVKNVYAAGDVFVYASKSETQGMIITEAMYAGLPVVAVSATGIKDLVGNHVTGLLVKENFEDFANAVKRLVSDGELRKKFSENAKKVAQENYTSKVCAEKMLEIYEKAIARKR